MHVLRTLEEIESIRPAWQQFAWPRIDADLDYYLAVLRSRPRGATPYVLAFGPRDRPDGLFVARSERVELPLRVGYRVLARPLVRAITLVHGGVAGDIDRATADELVACLRDGLRRGEADVAVLPSLRTDSPLFAALGAGRRRPSLTEIGPTSTHWTLALPDTMDEFLRSRSRSTREGLKRYEKRLLREHGDSLSVRRFDAPEQIDEMFRAVGDVAAKTYQHGLGVALEDTEQQRPLVTLALARGWFRAWVLSLEDTPIAFWHGLRYGGTFFIGTPGYDPAYADLRVGTYLQLRMTEELCEDPGVERIDYGFGEAEYKRRLGNETWEEATVTLVASRPRMLALTSARRGADAGVRLARKALGEERAGRIKRAWRARLTHKDT